MSVLLTSNEFWGRKSGTRSETQGNIIRQQQWGAGVSRDGKNIARRFHWPLPAKLMPSRGKAKP